MAKLPVRHGIARGVILRRTDVVGALLASVLAGGLLQNACEVNKVAKRTTGARKPEDPTFPYHTVVRLRLLTSRKWSCNMKTKMTSIVLFMVQWRFQTCVLLTYVLENCTGRVARESRPRAGPGTVSEAVNGPGHQKAVRAELG